MITLITREYNHVSQKNYEKYINNLNFASLQCTCGAKGGVTRHGYYTRYIKTPNEKVELLILRVKCPICRKTHAILLDCIVPYSQIPMIEQIRIIMNFEEQQGQEKLLEANLDIDESNIAYVLRNYKSKWRERLRSLSLCISSLLHDPPELIITSFTNFSINFMQIHCTLNILHSTNHIT